MPLTARQQRFVAEYVVDLNATQAAIRAGYSPVRASVTASELMARPEIAQAVRVTNRKVVAAAEDSAEDVLRDLKATYDAAMKSEQYGPAVSALNLRAKRHPEFSDKHEVDARIGVMLVRQTRGLRG